LDLNAPLFKHISSVLSNIEFDARSKQLLIEHGWIDYEMNAFTDLIKGGSSDVSIDNVRLLPLPLAPLAIFFYLRDAIFRPQR
jgi:hypothetical protein